MINLNTNQKQHKEKGKGNISIEKVTEKETNQEQSKTKTVKRNKSSQINSTNKKGSLNNNCALKNNVNRKSFKNICDNIFYTSIVNDLIEQAPLIGNEKYLKKTIMYTSSDRKYHDSHYDRQGEFSKLSLISLIKSIKLIIDQC